MGHTKRTYETAKANIEKRRINALNTAEKHKDELRTKYPEYREMEQELSSTAKRIVEALALGNEEAQLRINEIKNDNLLLQQRMQDLITSNGYPADYTRVKYYCGKCEDTGYYNYKECECLKAELARISIENSGVGDLVKLQRFENFDLSYYAGVEKELVAMTATFNFVKNYAENFVPEKSPNLLFIGATGLGKTHLSTACAKVVIERGNTVVYDTAQNILSDFEQERFRRDYSDSGEKLTQKYFDCDLLIIDDLGTELINSFIVSTLYNLINSRINSHKPMIISTNLSRNEIMSRYDSRIASRMIGEFLPFAFYGKDVRMQKLGKK